jgi:rhodanese-related sulfurtransferase
MKPALLILSLSIFFYACGPQSGQNDNKVETVKPKGQIQNVSSAKFYELIQSDNGIVLDVRTLGEFQQGHLPNALVIDIYQRDFEEKIKSLPKDKEIYVYCTVGARSRQAAGILQKNGFEKVYNLEGGIMDWARNRYPITQK